MYTDKDKVTDSWFYSETHPLLSRIFQIYVNGDKFHFIPLLIIILLVGLISWRFMIIMFGVYLSIRGLGEMIYWLLQQFGDKEYRPSDRGFKNLSNLSIYIIYQTGATVTMFVGIVMIIFTLLYLY